MTWKFFVIPRLKETWKQREHSLDGTPPPESHYARFQKID